MKQAFLFLPAAAGMGTMHSCIRLVMDSLLFYSRIPASSVTQGAQMSDSIKTLPIGKVAVSIINVGDIVAPLTTWMDPPAGGWPPDIAPVVTERQRFAHNCIYARVGSLSLLVDSPRFDYAPDSPELPPHYTPPPDLFAALASLGVAPEAITHIVITHVHWDHINGLSVSRAGAYVPAFPNARVYLGRGDFERPETQKALSDLASLESHTLGMLQKAGLLELSEGTGNLAEGVQIIAAPGETPGHQMARITSEGHSLYCVGDLLHGALEIEQPQYAVRWAEPRSTLASRHALTDRAVAEDALIVATHVHGAARLRRDDAGVHLVAA
jgi:glyoxylase-like metal-dependent hydrolase (beta-lactamase superfamily II)